MAWVSTRWAQLKRDVWDDPTIRPMAAVLLSALVGLVLWLTLTYAADAAGDTRPEEREGGVIPEGWGRIAIFGMTALTLLAGFEPIVARRVEIWWRSGGERGWRLLTPWLSIPVKVLAVLAFAPARIASTAWSSADYLLARPCAALAGAAWRGGAARYWHFILLLVAVVSAVVFLPDQLGLPAIVAGILAIVSIVRRWTWIEADRDTFLIERGKRKDTDAEKKRRKLSQDPRRELAQVVVCLVILLSAAAAAIALDWTHPAIVLVLAGPLALFYLTLISLAVMRIWVDPGASALRVDFEEDLRDEAMVALTCLFFLIPLGLDVVQQTTFAFRMDSETPGLAGLGERFWLWLGYFGAELAKTVPFVDWSESFHVANGSPIYPITPFGMQLAFMLRAGLDLLFLAAVVQAVGIAGRLRDQKVAFRNSRLPILEPFAEAFELSRAGAGMRPALEIADADQGSIAAFPRYEPERLEELIRTLDTRDETDSFRAAVCLLARQGGARGVDALVARGNAEPDKDLQTWILSVAMKSPCERGAGAHDGDRITLNAVLGDSFSHPADRAAAARRLGRLPPDSHSTRLLSLMLNGILTDDPNIRADAAVALSKLAPRADLTGPDVLRHAKALAASLPDRNATGSALMPALCAAHALARLQPDAPADEIAGHFPASLRDHARRAALIQAEPMTIEAASGREIGTAADQLVGIWPGRAPFRPDFVMGAPHNSPMSGTRNDQTPPTPMTMSRPFAVGRFPVTNREFLGFAEAMGMPRPGNADQPDLPAYNITWPLANRYARWIARITGELYRLPSEAEWEYACRAGTNTLFWWGDAHDASRLPDAQITEVNRFAPNPWGVWDLYGNVYEWCADPWHATHEGRPTTGEAWLAGGEAPFFVVRGGSWSFPVGHKKQELRSSYRNRRAENDTATNFGFRLARSLPADA